MDGTNRSPWHLVLNRFFIQGRLSKSWVLLCFDILLADLKVAVKIMQNFKASNSYTFHDDMLTSLHN